MVRAVCMVDSDASVREGLSRAVESAGYEVRRIASVEEFVAGVQAMKLGAIDFLSKPVDVGKLRETVAKALARRVVVRAHAGQRQAIVRGCAGYRRASAR